MPKKDDLKVACREIRLQRERIESLEGLLKRYPQPPKRMESLRGYLNSVDAWRKERIRMLAAQWRAKQ